MNNCPDKFKQLIVYKDEVIVDLEDLQLVLERIASVYPLLDEKVNTAINQLKEDVIAFEMAWEDA